MILYFCIIVLHFLSYFSLHLWFQCLTILTRELFKILREKTTTKRRYLQYQSVIAKNDILSNSVFIKISSGNICLLPIQSKLFSTNIYFNNLFSISRILFGMSFLVFPPWCFPGDSTVMWELFFPSLILEKMVTSRMAIAKNWSCIWQSHETSQVAS